MKKQTWTWISAVAAMLAASGLSVRAQDAPTPPAPPASGMDTGTDSTATPPAPDSTMNSGATDSGSDSPAMRPPSMNRPDYRLLHNRDFDYQDLKQAAAVGFSDDDVARIFLIASMTGVPFRDIRDAVQRGVTFYQLIDQYSLDGSQLNDVSEEKMQIAAYEAAYEASGSDGLKRSASAQDSELQASFARFKQLNDSFPATATPSTLVFQPSAPAPEAAATETTVRAVRPAPAPVETAEETPTATVKPALSKAPVKHAAAVKQTRAYHRTRRHHMMREHQVHHTMPVYMRRGS